ncbi:MAG: hypothetical protein KBT34_10585 [Prevotella sp.]|nr:hypothetical protein [Candidatus Prevotella equi]
MAKVIELGNMLPPRKGWKSPQDGRVFSIKGISPTIEARTSNDHIKILTY